MKIILKEDIANLGYKDDVVEVKSGYGRNYLIPQGKAVIASPGALKQLAETLKACISQKLFVLLNNSNLKVRGSVMLPRKK